MHELGIAFQIVKEVDALAEKNKTKAVKKVTLEIGEVSTIVPRYLYDIWPWACKNNSKHLKDCQLEIIELKAISYCKKCKKFFDTVNNGVICPKCKKTDTYLVKGNEAVIKSIEVKE